MALIAKPIVKNKRWLVINDDKKVGNVEICSRGYIVKIGDKELICEDEKAIQQIAKIDFQTITLKPASVPYAEWPTDSKTFNDLFDVKRKLHIYTKEVDSKCYYAAGWFKVKMDDNWQTLFCPKYIFLQRYSYIGPFKSQKEAEELSHQS